MNRSNERDIEIPRNILTDPGFIISGAGLSYSDDEAFLGTSMGLTKI